MQPNEDEVGDGNVDDDEDLLVDGTLDAELGCIRFRTLCAVEVVDQLSKQYTENWERNTSSCGGTCTNNEEQPVE